MPHIGAKRSANGTNFILRGTAVHRQKTPKLTAENLAATPPSRIIAILCKLVGLNIHVIMSVIVQGRVQAIGLANLRTQAKNLRTPGGRCRSAAPKDTSE